MATRDAMMTRASRSVYAATIDKNEMFIRAGTIAANFGFITPIVGADSSCSNEILIRFPDGEVVNTNLVNEVCSSPPLVAPTGGQILDGGYISIEATVGGQTAEVAHVEASWDSTDHVIEPDAATITLTAHPFGNYHFDEWQITSASGLRIVTTPTVIRLPGSSDYEYLAIIQQNSSSSGGSGGSGTGGDSTCLSCGRTGG